MEALESMRWMIDCCRDMLRIRNIPADVEADLPNEDHRYLYVASELVAARMGDPEKTPLTVRHIRLRRG
jgi:hypothetical protein